MFKNPCLLEDIILGFLSLCVGACIVIFFVAVLFGDFTPTVEKVIADDGTVCYVGRSSSGVDCNFGGDE